MPSLDRDSRVLAIQLVRRYKRYQENLAQKREEILHGSLPPPDESQEGWEHETLTVSERLSRLEQGHIARVTQAVEAAWDEVGKDLQNDQGAAVLREAVWRSCLSEGASSSRAFEERLPVSRASFYRRKNEFLAAVVEKVEAL